MGEILLNQLFAGEYLQEGSNIGHEIINLFRDDNNKNYLFVTPGGSVNSDDVESVVFLQNLEARETMEVIMKASGVSKINPSDIQNISYAGVKIVDIFKKNLYHGEIDTVQTDIMVTYLANDVRFPKKNKRIVLTVNPNYESDDDNTEIVYLGNNKTRIVGQGMRTYLSIDSHHGVYSKIRELLDDESLWEDNNTTYKLISNSYKVKSNSTFLDIIRKENDELVMSNLLAYYFNLDHNLFTKFVNEVLGVDNFKQNFEIVRESIKNIDLWIRDEDNVLVIENKIKSGINGKKDDGSNQLNKYYEYTEQYKNEGNVKNAYYFIFEPNYNNLKIKDNCANIYKKINYSEIYNFFKKNASEYINDKYFPDFLIALYNQTMSYSEMRFSIMRNRFLEKINQK